MKTSQIRGATKPSSRVATPKQILARKRNWEIRQLRAYFHLCPPAVSKEAVAQIRHLIDIELTRLGAETETERTKRVREEMEKAWAENEAEWKKLDEKIIQDRGVL